MRLLCSAVIALVLGAASAEAQAVKCGHMGFEAPEARQSRDDALAATHLINTLLAQSRPGAYPSWDALAKAPGLAAMRSDGGRLGELARKIEWGAAFPLPNWRIHFVAQPDAYAFSLVDTADACGLTFSTNDTGVITEGYPLGRRRGGLVPITE